MTTFTEFAEIILTLTMGAAIALLIGYSMLRLILGAMFRNLGHSSGLSSPAGIPQLQLPAMESRSAARRV